MPSEGTTPDAAEPTAEPAAEPDGEADAAPGPSDGSTPVAAETAVEEDPFSDTTAASYMLNGKPVAVEDIRVFKEGGAVIRPESLPNILSKLAERDTLQSKFQTRDTEYQTLSKVTEWHDEQNDKTFTGPEAAIELRIRATELLAENQLLVDHLTDPDKLFSILATEQVPDGKGGMRERVILNPAALASLQTQNELRNLKASQAVRAHYKGILDTASKAETPVDYATAAPALITQVAQASNLDASVLTPADRSILAKHLPFHARNGLASLEWQELVKERIQERLAAKTSGRTIVDTTTKAVKDGQARMLAAARGVKPSVARATPKPVVPTPAQVRADNEGDMFDAMLSSSASAMRTARS